MKKTMIVSMTLSLVFAVGSAFATDTAASAEATLFNGITCFNLGQMHSCSATAANDGTDKPFNGITVFNLPVSGSQATGSCPESSPAARSIDKLAYNGITVFNR